jgi:hypothetical protein
MDLDILVMKPSLPDDKIYLALSGRRRCERRRHEVSRPVADYDGGCR